MGRRTTNYLNNRDLLKEIHKSKTLYSEYDDKQYADFDVIIYDLAILTDDDACREETYRRFEQEMTVNEFMGYAKKQRIKRLKRDNSALTLEEDDIMISDLVFRYMTYEHIEEDKKWPEEKEKKKASDGYIKVCFPPYQHYIIENGLPRCVGVSHYKNGNFDPEAGKMTDKLGYMFMLLVEKISKKGNWRNYTYIDEMKSSALLQLSQVGLQFDEGRSLQPNPFAFYTTVVNNAFKRVLNTEKTNRNIRDDLIEMQGQTASFTRQLEGEMEVKKDWYFDTSVDDSDKNAKAKKS